MGKSEKSVQKSDIYEEKVREVWEKVKCGKSDTCKEKVNNVRKSGICEKKWENCEKKWDV